jgi:hypothetical protein
MCLSVCVFRVCISRKRMERWGAQLSFQTLSHTQQRQIVLLVLAAARDDVQRRRREMSCCPSSIRMKREMRYNFNGFTMEATRVTTGDNVNLPVGCNSLLLFLLLNSKVA